MKKLFLLSAFLFITITTGVSFMQRTESSPQSHQPQPIPSAPESQIFSHPDTYAVFTPVKIVGKITWFNQNTFQLAPEQTVPSDSYDSSKTSEVPQSEISETVAITAAPETANSCEEARVSSVLKSASSSSEPLPPASETADSASSSVSSVSSVSSKPCADTSSVTKLSPQKLPSKLPVIRVDPPLSQSTIENTESTDENFDTEVLHLINEIRSNEGLKPLKINSKVQKAARLKSQDMGEQDYFDHHSPTYGNPNEMLKQRGIQFTYIGENIAAGQETPEEVVNAWMNSDPHCDNILSPTFTQTGIGTAFDSCGNILWTQIFIE